MSWLQPQTEHRDFVAALQCGDPDFYKLARVLSLALRIEPLLLRNARLRFAPTSITQLENDLWFSPMMRTRSSNAVVVHAGIARLLTDDLAEYPKDYKDAWRFGAANQALDRS